MNLEPKDSNKINEFFHKLYNKAEDILFSVISKIPEKLMPAPFLEWLGHYTDRRMQGLRLQFIRQQWKKNSLEKLVADIRTQKQDTKKAPSDN